MANITIDEALITAIVNRAKELFLHQMRIEGHIEKSIENKMNQYAIVVSEKGYFGKLYEKWFSKSESTAKFSITVVKILDDEKIV